MNGDFLEPEKAEGFEVGVKAELLNNNLFATLAYFDITKQNVATTDPDFQFASIATGEQHSRGVELDVTGQILPGWDIIAFYAYIDAEVTQDNTIPVGNRLPGAAKHSAGLWTTYQIQSGDLQGLGFGLGINYVGSRFGDLENTFEVGDYFLTNAAIHYRRDNWRFALNLNNLFDVRYISSVTSSDTSLIIPGAPFSVVGSISGGVLIGREINKEIREKTVRMIVTLRLLLLAMLIAFAIAACSKTVTNLASNGDSSLAQSPSADCRTIKHQVGETEVCGQPQKIVALSPTILELLLALDVQPAGFADFGSLHTGDYDNPSQQIPYLGSRVTSQPANVGGSFEPSIESILKVQPDLILGTEYNVSQYETFSKIAPTLLFEWAYTETNLRAIAQAVRRTEKAEELIAQRQQQIADAREDFAPVVEAYPHVLALSTWNLPELSLLTETNSECGPLIKDLGFQLVYLPGIKVNDPSVVPPISLEILPQLNKADSIILLGHNQNRLDNVEHFEEHVLADLKQSWKQNAIAQSLNASKTGRVYFIPAYLCLGLPGPIGTELYLNELK